MCRILDAVPDSVYICSKAKEDAMPVGLYANNKMNSFFGCDIVNPSEKKRVRGIGGLLRMGQEWNVNRPLTRKIFQTRQISEVCGE